MKSQKNKSKRGVEMLDLNKDVKYVKTVGPSRVKLLNKLKIYTLKDLIVN